jgi:nicotinamide riboside kinase
MAEERRPDLTLLCDIDIPWVNDGQRFLRPRRAEFMKRCVRTLEEYGRPYRIISGTRNRRLATAKAVCQRLERSRDPAEARKRLIKDS